MEKLTKKELLKIRQNYYNTEQLLKHSKMLEKVIIEINKIVNYKSLNEKNWTQIKTLINKIMEHI